MTPTVVGTTKLLVDDGRVRPNGRYLRQSKEEELRLTNKIPTGRISGHEISVERYRVLFG